MRALQYKSFGDETALHLVDVPDPHPGPGQVRVALRAASVIPLDWKLRSGHLQHLFEIEFPKVPGRDGAGIIDELGDGVDFAAIGDEVCVVAQPTERGTHAGYFVCGQDAIVAKPKHLTFPEAAALMHAGVCAWISVVEQGQVQPGTRVLIHGGAGAIGGMAIQIAKNAGAIVSTTCRSSNVDYVKSLGADAVSPYDTDDFSQIFRNQDLVIDLIGGDVHCKSYESLRADGRLVYLIAEPFEAPDNPRNIRAMRAVIHDRPEALAAVIKLVNDRVIHPQVFRTLPLDQAREAFRMLEAGQVSRGRMILDIL